jgi:signal transduction histidine kinase
MPQQSHQSESVKTDLQADLKAKDKGQLNLFYRLPILSAFVVLLIGLGVTALVSRGEFINADERDQMHFDRLVDQMQAEVTRRVTVYRYGMMGTRSVFAASNYVDRDEFIDLVSARELPTEFPGALGIGYIERVRDTSEDVSAFIDRVQEEGAPWFEITTPPDAAPLEGSLTDDRYIIKYIEPLADNRSAHGLDIGSHPVRREAAERALRVNDASLTGAIQLVQDDEHVAGFLYLLPHYKPGMPLDTLEQRTEALAGWVYMPMLGPKVFDGVTSITHDELDIDVFDGEATTRENLIYDADGCLTEAKGDSECAGGAFHTVETIEIGGRTWALSLSVTPQFVYASRSTAWLLLMGGAVVSLLLAMLAYSQGAATRRAWALAEGMTSDLREYANKAGQATQAKSDFLANMSHEIRTPMTAILGFTDLLRTQIDDDNRELMDHAETIRRNGEHLLSLINDILDMSKIEAGKLDVEQIEVRPDALVGEVLSLMRVKADEKNLPIDAELITPIPATIQSDPVRLRQVLVNLIGNAIKFTDSGGIKIEVSYDGPTQQLSFAVVDTGRGMTGEQVIKLFQAFEQADTTTTRQFGGTGLGLHISQRLAGMLGGVITCESEFGKGSTFTLSITAKTASNEEMLAKGPVKIIEEGPAVKPFAPDVQTVGTLAGLRILMAEDGKDNQRLINHHLTQAGARVTIVENGRLAVEELFIGRDIKGTLHAQPPFDLLLTDMQMPVMDGYTTVRLLREKGSALPIVALTAHAMKEDVQRCLAAGCDFYASKPIDKQKLIEICREAAGRHPAAA